MSDLNKLIIKMIETNSIIINDCNGDREEKLIGIVEFMDPNRALACCVDHKHFPLNACIISDGKLHYSGISNGDMLYGITPEDILKYNYSVPYKDGKIRCIHLPNGNKVYHPDVIDPKLVDWAYV